jgi:hypothetical protein
MAGFEQNDWSSEREEAPCEILRLVRPLRVEQLSSVNFHVHAMTDDYLLKVAARTARDVFAKAIEWHVVGRLTNISISDGSRRYSIAEFALVMALAEMASTEASATRNVPDASKATVE